MEAKQDKKPATIDELRVAFANARMAFDLLAEVDEAIGSLVDEAIAAAIELARAEESEKREKADADRDLRELRERYRTIIGERTRLTRVLEEEIDTVAFSKGGTLEELARLFVIAGKVWGSR